MRNIHDVFKFRNDKGGIGLVKIADILCARSDQNYVHIYTATRKITQHMTFAEFVACCHWDLMLFKIHKQYLLRFDCIHEIRTDTNEGDYITLTDVVHQQLRNLDDFFTQKTLPLGAEGKILLVT